MLSVIGIHAKIQDGNRPISMTSGHAWLTLHFTNNRSDSVGLWPANDDASNLPRVIVRDPIGFTKTTEEQLRIEWGREVAGHYKPYSSRYYGLRQGQQSRATMVIGKFTGWRLTNNCTTWAVAKIKEIFGEKLASTEFYGLIDTPRALGASLHRLESRQLSSIQKPIYP